MNTQIVNSLHKVDIYQMILSCCLKNIYSFVDNQIENEGKSI